MRSSIDVWANFLMNEKLDPTRCPDATMDLIRLAESLATDGPPCIRSHRDKLESRRKLVGRAMDLGIDLAAIRHKGRPAMGRGLLDAWNLEYARRFTDTAGTAGAREAARRDVKRTINMRAFKAPPEDMKC